jgi:hypothetical protein
VRACVCVARSVYAVRAWLLFSFLPIVVSLSLSLASVSFSRAVAPLPILHPCIVITGVERLRVR